MKSITIIGNERYEMEKDCDSEGPQQTTSSAEYEVIYIFIIIKST